MVGSSVGNLRPDDLATIVGGEQPGKGANDPAHRVALASHAIDSPAIETAADEWRASADLFVQRVSAESDSSLWIG